MIGLGSLRVLAGGAVVVGAFLAGWGVRGWREGAADTAEVRREMQVLAQRSRSVDKAAADHEAFKARARVREVVVEKEVERVVERPVYRNVCVDPDGLRILSDEIAARAAAGQPARAVPGPAEAGGR